MIPLSIPNLQGNEWKYVQDCLTTGWISSAGSYVNQFEDMVAQYAGAKYGIACMNGTAGLHIAQLVCGVKASDYVIAPNLTFVATLNAIKYTGATPILIDTLSNNWQMDLDLLETFLKEKTELKQVDTSWYSYRKSDGKRIFAVMPVHVLGNIGDMEHLQEIAHTYHLEIIEDSTEALGSYHNQKHAGTFGKFGVFSFNGNKIISSGGGGVIVTDDENLAKKAKHLTTTAKVSDLDYIHDEIGFNYRMVNILAAIGVAQMEQFSEILDQKKHIDAFYRKELEGVGDIIFQEIPENTNPNCWLFTFRTNKMRPLLKFLNDSGVQSRPFWMPMNQLEMFKHELFVTANNASKKLYDTCISIPSSSGLTQAQLKKTVETIKKFYS
jgi:aminotransferase in exopolysaccharide biosynthesis